MADSDGSRQCFNCDAKFDTDDAFWDHIYNVDCGTNSKGDSLSSVKDTTTDVKPVSKMVLSDEAAAVTQTSHREHSQAADHSDSPFSCALCELHFQSSADWYAHSKSEEHREKVTNAANRYMNMSSTKKDKPATVFKTSEDVPPPPKPRAFCIECQVPLPSEEAKEIHIRGKKHQKVLNQILKDNLFDNNTALGFSSSSSSSTSPMKDTEVTQVSAGDLINALSKTNKVDSSYELPEVFYCDYCRLSLLDHQSAQKHVSSKEHQQMVQLSDTQTVSSGSQRASLVDQLTAKFCQKDPSHVDQLITVLRRLCLTQLLALMHGLEQSSTSLGNNTQSNQNIFAFQSPHPSPGLNMESVTANDLLELFRAVCRDELERMWSSDRPIHSK